MSYLDDLINVQNDAFDNLYDIEIQLPSLVGGSLSEIQFRMRSGDIKIPEPTVEPYSIHYKTVEIQKPKPKIKLERKLSIQFRVNSNYTLYEAIKDWQELTFTDDGGYNPLAAGSYGKIIVSAYESSNSALTVTEDGASNRAKKWVFDNVWLAGISDGVNFKRDASDALKITADFQFIKMARS